MGKPFGQEIQNSIDTINWVNAQNLDRLSSELIGHNETPVFIVGSGGSLSACHLASYLFQGIGIVARAITPFELFYATKAIRNKKILFISASGKNSDILFAFKTVMKSDPESLITICMKKGTKIKDLSKGYSSTAKVHELVLPSGKDGFLATNSLIAYFGILLRSFGHELISSRFNIPDAYDRSLRDFIAKINKSFSYMILFGGSGQPVAIDLESKFVEAALGNISICDYRNFAHGRHHWFAKRGNSSCIIALSTAAEEKIASKTLSLLPKDIPILNIKSDIDGPQASLDLLHKAFYLVKSVGKMQNIDPGRPGVPEYGSKLYNLKYSTILRTKDTLLDTAIRRKANCSKLTDLSETECAFWATAFGTAVKRINQTNFGAVVFDYDGTLCDADNRFGTLREDVAQHLIRLLSKNIVIGIATGRGKSARIELQKWIPKQYWQNVVVGYYNGSDIALLEDDSKPLTGPCQEAPLLRLYSIFRSNRFALEFAPDLRPFQLTVQIQGSGSWSRIKPLVLQVVKAEGSREIEFLESTHSIDIVKKPECSKLNILPVCRELMSKHGNGREILCIGDKGQWPGNDYELLNNDLSLSVNEVSSDPKSGWNLASVGAKNVDALLEYFEAMTVKKQGLKIEINEKSVS